MRIASSSRDFLAAETDAAAAGIDTEVYATITELSLALKEVVRRVSGGHLTNIGLTCGTA